MRLLILGAGGHAKVVADAAMACGLEIAGVVGGPGSYGELLGHRVERDESGVEADGFIVAIGDNAARAREFERLLATGLPPVSVVHPSAVIAPSARIGAGVFVAAGVIVNAEASIGEDVILNTGCTVDHDCLIGAHSHVGPGASLCGGVKVGEGALLGVGTCAIPLAGIGEWSVVGAGAAVTTDLPARTVCAGVPARPLRSVDDESRRAE